MMPPDGSMPPNMIHHAAKMVRERIKTNAKKIEDPGHHKSRFAVVNVMAFPVGYLVTRIHHLLPHFGNKKQWLNVTLGIVVMCIGAGIAHYAKGVLGDLPADTVGYAIHGLGLMPIVKIVEQLTASAEI